VPLLVGGSTHSGEEEALLAVLDRAEEAGRDLALVLAPRHPERFDAVERVARETGRVVRRRSEGAGPELAPGNVLLLDSLGELTAVYGRATAAFVGGSLVPRGGHNVLEPVFAGCPVFFGPHTQNAREATRILLEAGAAVQVANAEELAATVLSDLADPGAVATRVGAGARILAAHRGATQRSLDLIARVVDRKLVSAQAFAPGGRS